MEEELQIPFNEELTNLFSDKEFKRKLYLFLHFRAGYKITEIERLTQDNYMTIWRTIDKWRVEGSIDEEQRPGRPREYTLEEETKVVDAQRVDRRKTTKAIFNELADEAPGLSYDQTKRIIRSHYTTVTAPRSIQISDRNKELRVQWIEEHERWRTTNWHKVVFTDEKVFELCPQTHKVTIRLLPGEDREDFPAEKILHGGGTIMFWGAINGGGQLFFDRIYGKLNADTYCNFLLNTAIPEIRKLRPLGFTCVQENAKPHSAALTQAFMKDQHIRLEKWPAQSPDLNPIEEVWGWMGLKLKGMRFNNIEDLETYVFNLWEEIPKEVILAYIDKLPEKMVFIRDHHGDLYSQKKERNGL